MKENPIIGLLRKLRPTRSVSRPEIPTGWISQVNDEELRRQEMSWACSEENLNSPEGQVLVPLIRDEMGRRGIEAYNLNPDDPEHFEQMNDIIQRKTE